jgi:hypothetical protein
MSIPVSVTSSSTQYNTNSEVAKSCSKTLKNVYFESVTSCSAPQTSETITIASLHSRDHLSLMNSLTIDENDPMNFVITVKYSTE